MTEQAHTPGPWYWDEYGQLSSKHGWPVIAAGINKAGGAYVAVNQEDKPVLAAASETAAERDKLREINAELLEALVSVREDIIGLVEIATEMLNERGAGWDPAERTYEVAVTRIDTAIAKAKGAAS